VTNLTKGDGSMGKNYHPTLGQASLIYGISEWALEHLVNDHNKRFPDKAIRPLVPASDSPALWNSEDIEPLIHRYHLLRDLNDAMIGKSLKQLGKAVNELVAKLELSGQRPEMKAIEHQEGTSLKTEKEKNQRQRVIEELTRAQGNITKAAKELGVHRQQLQKLVKKYGLYRSQFTPKPPETGEPEYHLMSFENAKRAFEARYIKAVLEAAGGNVAEAARVSGIFRQNLHEKIKRFKIDVQAIREGAGCSFFQNKSGEVSLGGIDSA